LPKSYIKNLLNILNSDEAQNFLNNHQNSEINKLYLKYSSDAEKKVIIDQIYVRQKIRKKLREWFNNSRLIFPKHLSHEQSSSEETARLKSSLIKGNHILDITGGMGVDLYYFSKVFKSCTYIERQKELSEICRHNFSELGASNIEVINGDGLSYVSKINSDYINIDPARRDLSNSKLVSLADCEPNVLKIKDDLIANGRRALIKTSPMLDIHSAISDLEYVSEVWLISLKNETKELLFLLKEGENKIKLRTFNILANKELEVFDFYWNEKGKIRTATKAGKYLYEPNSSMQKAKGGDIFAEKHDLQKLDSNTNLYFSDQIIDKFPGKIFEVIKILKPYDKGLKNSRFNIISRNFPDKADLIQKKLRIKPAENDYLIACRSSFNNLIFIQARLIKV
tara:strand:- start:63469 stop:64656 length:1188 start_codon:yes stop_codon:yes gene_type:complete